MRLVALRKGWGCGRGAVIRIERAYRMTADPTSATALTATLVLLFFFTET